MTSQVFAVAGQQVNRLTGWN